MEKKLSIQDFGVTKQSGMLRNGLKIIVLHRAFAPIRLHLLIRAGSVYEPSHQPGLAHFAEHILMNGSKAMPQKEFWGIPESIGAYANAKTGKSLIVIELEIAGKEQLPAASTYFSVAAADLYVAEDTVEKEKKIITREAARTLSSQPYMREAYLFSKLASGTAWEQAPIGMVEAIESFSCADVEDFLVKHCTVENMALVVAGDCTLEDIDLHFSSIPFLHENCNEVPEDPKLLPPGEMFWYEQDIEDVQIYFGFAKPQLFTRQAELLNFAVRYAHDGLASLFMQRIREEKRFSYSISVQNVQFMLHGYFATCAGTTHDLVEQTIDAIRDCYRELVQNGISQERIDRKVETMIWTAMRNHQTSEQWVRLFQSDALYPDRPAEYGDFPDILNYHQTFKKEEVVETLDEYIGKCLNSPYLFLIGKGVNKYI